MALVTKIHMDQGISSLDFGRLTPKTIHVSSSDSCICLWRPTRSTALALKTACSTIWFLCCDDVGSVPLEFAMTVIESLVIISG